MASCTDDRKKQYLESGDREFDRGRYQEAAVQYENARKIDPHDGLTHYKLGVVYMKLKPSRPSLAVKEYRRAVEVLKGNRKYREEYRQSLVKLSDILLIASYNNKESMADVEEYCDQLFRMDPDSFDAFRLTGDLNIRASQTLDTDFAAAERLRNAALDNYRKADAIRPGDPGVSLQIALLLRQQTHYAEAEPYFRQVIDNDKSSYTGYISLYRLYLIEQKPVQAEQLLSEAIRNMPERAEEWNRLRTGH
jgi:tetratricopeptide (TPR) repeat protein